jgi:leucyl aminopeptidase
VVKGAELLKKDFPLIHAVGQASAVPPRLIDMRWGKRGAPRLTLVGKGVAFDTGGLDIKPASGMRNMKKDMGGAANILALARMVVDALERSPARSVSRPWKRDCRQCLPAPATSIRAARALTVEIGNTDAEGRLVLADALTLADEEKPDLIIDMATLTGAARVALGPDVPPFYSTDDTFADAVAAASLLEHDPVWRMPLWAPYAKGLSSRSPTSAMSRPTAWPDRSRRRCFCSVSSRRRNAGRISTSSPGASSAKPHAPVGGEAQAIRGMLLAH